MNTITVPETLAELLTSDWLTAALQPRFPGIEVASVTPGPIVERVSTNARFTVQCVGEPPAGFVPTLCVKGYFSEAGRVTGGQVGATEVVVYGSVVEPTGVRTLRCVFANVDPDSGHGIVITEDVIEAGGQFLDALSPYTPDQAALSLEQLAKLHAHTKGRYADEPRLAPRMLSYLQARGISHIEANFAGAVGVDVHDDVRAPQRLLDALRALSARYGDGPDMSVIHGDAHVGNLYLDADGRPGLLDWQCTQLGHWSVDIAYHIGSALTTADRERSERDLLSHYLDHVRANGVEPPSWDDAWLAYRAAVPYGFFLWAITVYVDPAIIKQLLQRLSASAAAHDSFGLLGV